MKTKDWIALGIMAVLVTASRSLGAPEMGVLDHLEQTDASAHELDTRLQDLQENTDWQWPELEKFQATLWRAMALDPTVPLLVPAAQVPKSLYSSEMNKELQGLLEELKNSTFAKTHGADVEFDQYLITAEEMMQFRVLKKYTSARAVAKRGILDAQYELLLQKVGKPELVKASAQKLVQQIFNDIEKTRQTWVNQSKDLERKNIFGASNQQFAWVMIAIFLGFFLGIAAFRISPDFFQKFLDSTDSTSQPIFIHPEGKLDYARWLREFEEHLTRLKTSQVSHERRIEEVVGVSDKLNQQALALYADVRIKSEANLELQMSNLLREIHHQFEQGQKLAAGDRTQIHQMLEHCLQLCDAIENDGINFDRLKNNKPPAMKSA